MTFSGNIKIKYWHEIVNNFRQAFMESYSENFEMIEQYYQGTARTDKLSKTFCSVNFLQMRRDRAIPATLHKMEYLERYQTDIL